MSLAELENIKDKKSSWYDYVHQRVFNHPNRLSGMSLSGTVTYTRDERLFTSPTSILYEFDLDLSAITGWLRKFQIKEPWLSGFIPVEPDAGEFVLAHKPKFPWLMEDLDGGSYLKGDTPAAVVIGTCTKTVFGTPDVITTNDIFGQLDFIMTGGGDGSVGGRGDDSDDEKITINIFDPFSGTNSGLLPGVGALVLRLPWEMPWASESTIFSDAFDAEIAAFNAADGGGHSGTCSMTLNFDFAPTSSMAFMDFSDPDFSMYLPLI